MIVLKERTDKETAEDYLLRYLESVASKINKSSCSFRAYVDKSGLILQLYISEK